MALEFDAATHTYRHNGVVVPSVTQILAPLYDGLQHIRPDVLAAAGERGTAVHLACELDDEDDLDESTLDPVLVPYLDAWRLFKQQKKVRILAIEARVFHSALRYAGTLDRDIEMDEEPGILDLKATAVMSPITGPQTAAYAHCTPGKRRRFGLQLRKDGTYRLTEFKDPSDLTCFMSLLNIHNWRLRHAA